ncbi:MAG: hypothetical protein ABI693_23175 [Bryobacteraceae bacterium]
MSRTVRYSLFLTLALGINLVDGLVVASQVRAGQRTAVAIAAVLDVVVVVSAIYYWLLVRPGFQRWWSLAPVAVAGLWRAMYLFPSSAPLRALAAGICELAVIAFVVVQVRRTMRGRRDADPVQALQGAVASLIAAPFAANLLATELSILYYAFAWRARPHVPEGTRAFTLHRRGGQQDILFVAAIGALFEIIPVHLLIHRWSAVGAWVATAVSVYGAVWLVGVARSLELRPVLVGPDYLDLRYGLLFRIRVSREMIASVSRALPEDAQGLVVPRRGEPNVRVEFVAPVKAERLFGSRKMVASVALAADDEANFMAGMVEWYS